jgi:ATP-dependent DNA ligase
MNIVLEKPILYILSNNKKRFWKIWIEEHKNNKQNEQIKDIYICRNYGIIGGKITIPEKKQIKHIGTITSLQKAITEVNFLWKKKKESGFQEASEFKDSNLKMKSSKVRPMGAHKLSDHYHKIKYPALVQKKLDGFRCLSHIDNKNVLMYSKSMKNFVYLNHIKNEILKIKELVNENIYLDGELYEHGLKLHDISSLVMKKYATKNDEENMKKISYYIFDIFDVNNLNEIFEERYKKLENIFKKYNFKYLKIVKCIEVYTYKEIEDLNNEYLYSGYEGVIVRNKDGIYKLNSKSYDVLRTKEFKKKKFKIIGAKGGRGTQKGAIIWKLECLNNNNKSFFAIPIGSIDERIKIYKKYQKNPENYIGKYVSVKYLEMTNDGCISRNPIVEIL